MTLTLLILCVVICAGFALVLTLAEAAFTRLTRKEAEEIAERRGSLAVEKILADPVPHTVALQMWRWFFAAALVVLVTVISMLIWDDLLIAGIVSAGVLFLGGILTAAASPRRLGRAYHSVVATFTASLVRSLRVVLGPLPQLLISAGSQMLPGTSGPDQGFFDDEEFREFVARASETDIIEDSEAELIQSVFDLSATRIRAVMVPRTDMVTVGAEATLPQVMSLFLRSGHSRVPVTRGSADEITGMVYLKDVAFFLHQLAMGPSGAEHAGRSADEVSVEELQRDVRYVPESKSVSEFLTELQRESTHVAVVVDEYGGIAGLVTLEDLIEEIVGEIVDEYDTEDAEVEELGDGRLRISARMSVDDFAELFDVDLDDEEEVDTVGGLLAKTLGRVPIAGSEVEIQSVVLHADRLAGRRNRVSHVLAWQTEDHRGARAGLGTADEQEALDIAETHRSEDSIPGHEPLAELSDSRVPRTHRGSAAPSREGAS